MASVLSLGELLIDFVSTVSGVSLAGAPAFQKAPGGAPANVAVGLARLGVSSAFMGKVGDDDFGHFLADTLAENGVDVSPLRFSSAARTALAFVSLRADGEREFMFYRNPSADMLFTPGEVDISAVRQARIFHYGSITLIHEPSRSATLHALETAADAGLLVSYDPNLRLNLWSGADEARAEILAGLRFAHVVKVSDEELVFLTGIEDMNRAAAKLWHDKMRLLVVSEGARGCRYYTVSQRGHVPGFTVDAVDTTGAGDGFMAGVLCRILQDADLLADRARLENALRFANAVGALTTTKRGAIPALPLKADVEMFLRDLE